MTHYIPIYARENGRKRQALCGAWILPREHSNAPECPECAAIIAGLRLDEHRTAAELFGDEADDDLMQ